MDWSMLSKILHEEYGMNYRKLLMIKVQGLHIWIPI